MRKEDGLKDVKSFSKWPETINQNEDKEAGS